MGHKTELLREGQLLTQYLSVLLDAQATQPEDKDIDGKIAKTRSRIAAVTAELHDLDH